MSSITTTNGKTFSHNDHVRLARLIYLRWGEDMSAAACAWRRLFQNNCTDNDFYHLVHNTRPTSTDAYSEVRSFSFNEFVELVDGYTNDKGVIQADPHTLATELWANNAN